MALESLAVLRSVHCARCHHVSGWFGPSLLADEEFGETASHSFHLLRTLVHIREFSPSVLPCKSCRTFRRWLLHLHFAPSSTHRESRRVDHCPQNLVRSKSPPSFLGERAEGGSSSLVSRSESCRAERVVNPIFARRHGLSIDLNLQCSQSKGPRRQLGHSNDRRPLKRFRFETASPLNSQRLTTAKSPRCLGRADNQAKEHPADQYGATDYSNDSTSRKCTDQRDR